MNVTLIILLRKCITLVSIGTLALPFDFWEHTDDIFQHFRLRTAKCP